MFVTAIARGIRMGVLDKAEFDPVVQKGWTGLVSTVLSNGTVLGVCCGTGIQPNAAAYYARPTHPACSGPGGAGTVLYAAVELAKLGRKY
jgi:unsaturated rhamnogalacturonyl hydrolase